MIRAAQLSEVCVRAPQTPSLSLARQQRLLQIGGGNSSVRTQFAKKQKCPHTVRKKKVSAHSS
jgi:hypothetical protein